MQLLLQIPANLRGKTVCGVSDDKVFGCMRWPVRSVIIDIRCNRKAGRGAMVVFPSRRAAALRNLREQLLWCLLAANKGPVVIALLQSLFVESKQTVPSSLLPERLTRDIEAPRAVGEELQQTPQAYVAEWLSQGWLTRRFPAGAAEEEYELSVDALTALRFVTGLLKPRTTATESRLLFELRNDVSRSARASFELLQHFSKHRPFIRLALRHMRQLVLRRSLSAARRFLAKTQRLSVRPARCSLVGDLLFPPHGSVANAPRRDG